MKAQDGNVISRRTFTLSLGQGGIGVSSNSYPWIPIRVRVDVCEIPGTLQGLNKYIFISRFSFPTLCSPIPHYASILGLTTHSEVHFVSALGPGTADAQ